MFKNLNDGGLYVGDMQPGDREATPEEVEADRVAKLPTYQQLRAPLYPPVTDALDAIVKGGQALEDYKAACMAVKAKYPKTI